jgi:cation:H+ antiporter
MLQNLLMFAGGLGLLLLGGRLLVSASVDAARRLHVSTLVVGLTLVAWGTSAPELALNIVSALKGRADLSLGNIVGANICNMALVLGVCAVIKPLVVQQRLIAVEIWLNAAILVFFAAICLIAEVARWQTAIMLAIFAGYSAWTIMSAMQQARREQLAGVGAPSGPDAPSPDPVDAAPPMSWLLIGVSFLAGLALLGAGGSLCSDGASGIAIGLGVPAAVVGVTIVSIGTTLPEMVTSVMAVRKGQTDLAMGNAIGSCLFNAGLIFGVVGLIAPPDSQVTGNFTIPLAYMALLAVALVPISRTFGKTVSRAEGAGLLASYAVFLAISAWSVLRNAPGDQAV